MTRLFINNFLEKEFFFITAPTDINYLTKVMRKKKESEILVFNQEEGEYLAQIIDISNKKITLKIIKKTKEYEPEKEINLIFSPIKSPRINFILEKSTELGITGLIPIQTKHSVIDKINIKKWEIYIKEASEQCERISLPTIKPLITIEKFLLEWPKDQKIILCNEQEKLLSLYQHLKSIESIDQTINLMIGPEGGFSKEEIEILKNTSFIVSVHLGPRILRAETAAVCAISTVQNMRSDCVF